MRGRTFQCEGYESFGLGIAFVEPNSLGGGNQPGSFGLMLLKKTQRKKNNKSVKRKRSNLGQNGSVNNSLDFQTSRPNPKYSVSMSGMGTINKSVDRNISMWIRGNLYP
ncbi:hypothetical protein CEXT_280711 [Caerostris extrusa]|uniref:Uncharacterized protein n=1 Tax=Caerostris extrusa TaxID=172846 RepID=A0AAV4MP77_CAEEX|nr:hypothetical protein CEXT_280711 [Caerostris extrusa]